MALAFAAASGASGQTPYDSSVIVPEVEVRSGPSPQFYATAKLRQGTVVHVLEEKDGWVAITPPPGSFSWINGRLIDRTGRVAVVLTEAPVRVGSSVCNEPPNREQVKLPRGAQVVILGAAHTPADDPTGGTWWPIQPPPQEVRYIPKEAVRASAPVENMVAAAPAGNPADKSWPVPGGVPPTPGGTPPAGNVLFDQAKQAEASGNLQKAVELYTQVYRQNVDSNHALAMDAINRANYIQSGSRPSVPPGYQPGIPSEASSGQQVIRPTPAPPLVPAQPVSNTQVGYAAQPPAAPLVQPSGPGRLRRAGFFVDGRQAYVLENTQGRPLLYITAQQGLNLEPYVNRTVELFGPVIYHGELRTNYMTAAQVNLLQ
jgi:hypothetical protein